MSRADSSPDAAAAPTPARQRRKAARPQELLDAALELFVEKGFAATRTEEVAARAGVSKGTLYLYYPSKEDLLKAVILRNISGEIAEGMDIVRGWSEGTPELLAFVLHEWWRRFGETRASGICKLMMSEARNFPEIASFFADEVIKPMHGLLRTVIERGVERGEFRAVPMPQTVQLLTAPMLYLVMNKHSFGACEGVDLGIDPRRVIDAHVELTMQGMLPRPATAGPRP
ncbi:TetR/AcrR family transcriptional regulator [Caldimonas sp. KR1-144]|uniref:TetR/AcrR family transcriptional regulator n=1 Tax=Caldimonas sp. KR1-144 TaxID=3400911 RepID=UPI003BFB179F